jgi:hypothetical protein
MRRVASAKAAMNEQHAEKRQGKGTQRQVRARAAALTAFDCSSGN